MAEKLIIEAMGSILKEVEFESLKQKVIPGTFVLESLKPFPGYHHEVPVKPVPGTIYFVTTEMYNRENITRKGQEIRKIFNKHFDSATGEISIYNDKYPCIRIHELDSYDIIEEIQNYFKDYGVKFRKFKKIKAKGFTKIKKFFILDEIESGVYLDSENENMAYFKMPYMHWKLFEKITYSIKNNWNKSSFDAAVGTIYRRKELQDIVRIYRANIDAQILLEIREKYLKEYDKFA